MRFDDTTTVATAAATVGQTALFKASQNDHKDAVRILLEANAQKDVMNYEQMKARDVTLNNDIDDMLH